MKLYNVNDILNKRILGRTAGNFAQKDGLALFWSGSGIELNVRTREVWVEFESDFTAYESWFCVYINGRLLSRQMAQKGKTLLCVARMLNANKVNKILIIKDTQAMGGDPKHLFKINKIALVGNSNSYEDEGEFLPVEEAKLKIEFVGDSITSGEGLKGAISEMDWISSWISVGNNYAMQTALNLNADFRILSQCGYGIVAAWDNNVKNIMPSLYAKVCGVLKSESQKAFGSLNDYDFSSWQPDFVVLNLGTNDNNAFESPVWIDEESGKEYKLRKDSNGKILLADGEKLVSAIVDFLFLIREKNPKAKIIWTYNMLALGEIKKYFCQAIEDFKIKSHDSNIYMLEFDSMEDCEVYPEDKGSRNHPGPKTHYLAAKKLIALIKSKM